jgi:hypothetical protein
VSARCWLSRVTASRAGSSPSGPQQFIVAQLGDPEAIAMLPALIPEGT